MARRFRKPASQEIILNGNGPLTEAQPKRAVYIEMFKAGPQISSAGQKMVFSEEDLDQVVNSYNPSKHEAPLIIGHEQDDSTPALGWVREVWRKGKSLWGKIELTPKAERLIRDGVFKKVSSSFYLPDADTNPVPGSLHLRHLGLVSIPAVKGLTAFSELIPEGSITITSRESSISFQETLPTMAKRKTEASPQVVDHADGKGMTINVNINGLKTEADTEPTVVEETGFESQNSGPAAPYEAQYADDGLPGAPVPGMADPSLQRMDMVEGPDGKEMGDEDGGEGDPIPPSGEGPDGMEGEQDDMDVDDVSGDDDEAVASDLASKYTEEQLIMALYQLANSGNESDMGEGYMGYSEDESDSVSFSEEDPMAERVAQLEEELAAQRRMMRQREISDFCEKLYDQGKLTEAVIPSNDLVRFMETLNAKNTVNFSETGKSSQFDFMKSMLENLPSMVNFNEVATQASAPPKKRKVGKPAADGYVFDERNAEIHAKAVEYSEANGVDYMSAVRLVISESF